MREWPAEKIAEAAGASLLGPGSSSTGPDRVVIDSRQVRPGSLFVALPGTRTDGGRFVGEALHAGAWGILAAHDHLQLEDPSPSAVLLSSGDPLGSLQRLARNWRRTLGTATIGVTGSTGKTTTKDLILALLEPYRRTVASRSNFNTEIGLPLEILNAPGATEVLVLEMAMRGSGQIAELAEIAEPDVGVLVNIGPVHLELLGSLEAIAAAKAELIAGLKAGATAVIPAGEPLLEPHLRSDLNTVTFGPGGDVRLIGGDRESVRIDLHGAPLNLEVPFTQAHLRHDLLAAVAAADAVGVTPAGRVLAGPGPGRGQRLELAGGITLIDDAYNANPVSMAAALDDLAVAPVDGGRRHVAILGDMLELGGDQLRFHREVGERAARTGVELLITVGPLARGIAEAFPGETHAADDAAEAAALAEALLRSGDVVLLKASRGVGLERVREALARTVGAS